MVLKIFINGRLIMGTTMNELLIGLMLMETTNLAIAVGLHTKNRQIIKEIIDC